MKEIDKKRGGLGGIMRIQTAKTDKNCSLCIRKITAKHSYIECTRDQGGSYPVKINYHPKCAQKCIIVAADSQAEWVRDVIQTHGTKEPVY